jgi:hypothetical protein
MAWRTRKHYVIRTHTPASELGNGRWRCIDLVEIRNQVARGIVLLQVGTHSP